MIIDKEMKRTIGYLWCAALLMAVCAAGITSCKKELPSVDVAGDAGATVNYDIANVIVKNGSEVVPATERVAVGTELTIEVVPAKKGLIPRTFVSLKVNDGDELVKPGATSATYKVAPSDKVVKIVSQTEGGIIDFKYDPENLFVCERTEEGEIGDDIEPGDEVNEGQKLFFISYDAKTPFSDVLVNGVSVMGNLKLYNGGAIALYEVPKKTTKLEIVAKYGAASNKVVLTFDKTVVKVGALEPNAEVNVGDKLAITPADADKVFEVLKINGNEIAEAAGKESYEYEVKSGDTEVKIEATVKAKAAPIVLTFGADVKVDGKASGDEVAAGDKLAITPADADKVFEVLKINGKEIADAAGKASYEYTVKADDTEVKIEATVKAKATPVALTFGAEVKVDGKSSGDKVSEGDKLTITPAEADKVFEKLTINGNEIAEAVGKESYEYTVKADDPKVEIEATLKAKATTITLTFDKTVVKVGTLEPNAEVNVGDKLTITPADATKVFDVLKINGNEIAEAAGKESYEYEVKAGDTEVKIEATVKAKATPIVLTFGADVKVDGKATGAEVNVGEELVITPVAAGKKFAELKINDAAIAEAVDKDTFTYTVKADDPKVEIVATLK